MAKSSTRKTNRNIKLCYRYYFYSELIGLKISKCIELLCVEFNLSESRILDLIKENSDTISNIISKQVTVQELAKRYPFFNWKYNIF